jgi:hypothetical protein
MKRINSLILAGAMLFAFSSCEKFIDINEENPNAATYSTPDLVLPQAIVYTANNTVAFNNYGAQLAGYMANGGGVSGWGAIITYNYSTTDFQGLWTSSYDNLQDYQYVINATNGSTEYAYFNAVAKIMKAFNFERLVNVYNDVPYSEAFMGTAKLQPKYDKAEDIYKDLAVQLDSAIYIINKAKAETDEALKPKVLGNKADVIFGGNVDSWKRFANTIKLRLMVRGNGKVTFTTGINPTTFDAVGFITDDVLVQPGFTKVAGKQNPQWNSFAYSEANAVRGVGGQYVPTPFILSFYDGTKIVDTERGRVTYKNWSGANGTNTKRNQLGNLNNPATGETPNAWFIGSSATTYSQVGIYKGPDAPQPIMLGAESYFFQSEAVVRGIGGITGDAKTTFVKGIESSFRYLLKDATGKVMAAKSSSDSAIVAAEKYIAANTDNYLVNFDKAVSEQEKLEAIITQKYIAVNMILSHEGWFDFIRTGYPRIVAGSTNATQNFASIASQATTPNKLPTRILYPADEFRYNQNNVPKGISPFSNKIFFAL